MTAPRLTVGISFFNTRDTLVDLARCMFAQTFTDWELILIDDGSTDGGVEIVNKIDDPRVTVICDGVNRGRSNRYNQITPMAKGEFIARFDADDLSEPTRFEKQIAFLDSHPDVDVVGTSRFSLAQGDVLKGRRVEPATHEEICRSPVWRGIRLCHGSIVGRKAWFEKFPYSERYLIALDTALWLSSWDKSTFANLLEPLYAYREYAAYSLSKYYRAKKANITALWMYGRKSVGLLPVVVSIMNRLGRLGIFAAITTAGFEEYLSARRSSELSEQDIQTFQDAMKIIRSTHVPGLDRDE